MTECVELWNDGKPPQIFPIDTEESVKKGGQVSVEASSADGDNPAGYCAFYFELDDGRITTFYSPIDKQSWGRSSYTGDEFFGAQLTLDDDSKLSLRES